MRRTRGKNICTGARRARSSARARRSARSSVASARSGARGDVPRRCARPSADASVARLSDCVRAADCSSAVRQSSPSEISRPTRSTSAAERTVEEARRPLDRRRGREPRLDRGEKQLHELEHVMVDRRALAATCRAKHHRGQSQRDRERAQHDHPGGRPQHRRAPIARPTPTTSDEESHPGDSVRRPSSRCRPRPGAAVDRSGRSRPARARTDPTRRAGSRTGPHPAAPPASARESLADAPIGSDGNGRDRQPGRAADERGRDPRPRITPRSAAAGGSRGMPARPGGTRSTPSPRPAVSGGPAASGRGTSGP